MFRSGRVPWMLTWMWSASACERIQPLRRNPLISIARIRRSVPRLRQNLSLRHVLKESGALGLPDVNLELYSLQLRSTSADSLYFCNITYLILLLCFIPRLASRRWVLLAEIRLVHFLSNGRTQARRLNQTSPLATATSSSEVKGKS